MQIALRSGTCMLHCSIRAPLIRLMSSQIQSILNPVQGPRDEQIRAGVKPPNHAKTNIAAIKEQSNLNNLRKAAEQQIQESGRLQQS